MDANGGTAAASYDGRGRLTALTDSLGNVTEYSYDKNGNLLSERLADGSETRYTYDVCGRVSSVTSGGETVSYTYDAAGNLLTETGPEGTASYAYDSMGRVTEWTEADGTLTKYRYDLAGRLVEKTDMDGVVSSYEWDGCGNLLLYTDTAGGYTAYYYDKLYRLQYVTAKDEFTGELVTVDWIEEEDDTVPPPESWENTLPAQPSVPKGKPQARMASGSTLKVAGVRSHSLHLEKVASPLESGGSGKKSTTSTAGEAKYLAQQAQKNLMRTMSAVRQTEAVAPASPAAQAARRAYYEAQQTYAKVQSSSRAVQQGSSGIMSLRTDCNRLQSLTQSTQLVATGAVTNRRIQQASKQYSPMISSTPKPLTPKGTTSSSPTVSGIGNGQSYDCGRDINALGAGDYAGIGESIRSAGAILNAAISYVTDIINNFEKGEAVKVDSAEKIVVHSFLRLGGIGVDILEIYLLYAGAGTFFASAPSTAGGSAVMAFAFLEAAAIAGVGLAKDAAEMLEELRKYYMSGEIYVDYRPDFSEEVDAIVKLLFR